MKAKSDALRLLSFRPRSVEELRGKLRVKKYAPGTIDNVIEVLRKQGLLDDEKFAKLYSNARVHASPRGIRQVEQELKKKGLSNDLIQRTVANLHDYDEKKTAYELAHRRFEKMTGISAVKKKTRIYGLLKRRGFQTDVIFAVLKDLFQGISEHEMTDDNG